MQTFRRNMMLMAALGTTLSAGAAAVATAYPDDGKVHVRHAVTEQECAFENRAQLDAFLANVADPDSWTVLGATAVDAVRPDVAAFRSLPGATPAADQAPTEARFDLADLRAGLADSTLESAAVAGAPASTENPAA